MPSICEAHLRIRLAAFLNAEAQPPVAVADNKAAEEKNHKHREAEENEGEVLGRLQACNTNLLSF